MDVQQFDFDLPESLIAQNPLLVRTESRLLVLDKQSGTVTHREFANFIEFLKAGDTLVLNDTRVIPARLFGIKPDTGAKVEVLLLKALGEDHWEALVRPGKRLRTGAKIHFGGNDHSNESPLLIAEVMAEQEQGGRLLRFQYDGIFNEILDRLGQMPLPPYIKEQLEDKERYQTVYAKHEGSAAAPTAGLHFTEAYLREIERKGVSLAYVTLHVGLGTFRPVAVDKVEQHEMHEEYYSVSAETAALLNRARQDGGRIIAVGTTSARTLETIGGLYDNRDIEACSGWTNIFIYPGYSFKLVAALLTNFHLPKSTLVMLVSALAGTDYVREAYKQAVERKYRFFSFGDAMFIY